MHKSKARKEALRIEHALVLTALLFAFSLLWTDAVNVSLDFHPAQEVSTECIDRRISPDGRGAPRYWIKQHPPGKCPADAAVYLFSLFWRMDAASLSSISRLSAPEYVCLPISSSLKKSSSISAKSGSRIKASLCPFTTSY